MAANRNGTQGDRIGALEEGYKNLGREIGGLRDDFAMFAREVRSELHTRNRTQWSPIIAGVAVIVSVLGGLITLGGSGITSDLSRHDHTLDRMADRLDLMRNNRFTADDGQELWNAVRALENEDFSRPEAERMGDLLRAEIERLRARINDHQADGHPARVEAIVDGIARRVELLEALDR